MQELMRGHKAEAGIIDWSDCKITDEEIKEVIKPFIPKEYKMKSNFTEYQNTKLERLKGIQEAKMQGKDINQEKAEIVVELQEAGILDEDGNHLAYPYCESIQFQRR